MASTARARSTSNHTLGVGPSPEPQLAGELVEGEQGGVREAITAARRSVAVGDPHGDARSLRLDSHRSLADLHGELDDPGADALVPANRLCDQLGDDEANPAAAANRRCGCPAA